MRSAEAILRLLAQGPKLTRQLAATCGIGVEYARQVCKCLHGKGLIQSAEGAHQITGAGRAHLESGVALPCGGPPKGKAASSRGRHLRQRAWSAMRMMTTFDVPRLMSLVCDGHEKGAEENLRNYCKALHTAGYLGVAPRTGSYFMRRNTGPLAPTYNRAAKTITDRNTGETITLTTPLANLEAAHAPRAPRAPHA